MARILLVEDVDDVRYILSRMLSRLGHRVTEEAGTAEGVTALQSCPFEVLVTDLWMPGADGFELIRQARMLRPQMHIVAISGGAPRHPLERSIEAAHEAGANAVLMKPIDRHELRDALGRFAEATVP